MDSHMTYEQGQQILQELQIVNIYLDEIKKLLERRVLEPEAK